MGIFTSKERTQSGCVIDVVSLRKFLDNIKYEEIKHWLAHDAYACNYFYNLMEKRIIKKNVGIPFKFK